MIKSRGGGPAGGNVISGNKKAGVTLDGATTTSVSNNVIGSDPSGTLRLGNPVGVKLFNASTDDVIGREFPNMILYNATAGVSVLDGGSVRDLILDNVLVNSGPGIDLGGDGVTPNHTGGPRVGPNFYQNTPVLTFSANGHLGITLHSDPLTTYRVDYFSSRPTPPSAGPQAERERGRVLMTTDAAGNAGPVVVTYQQEAGFTAFSATATGPSRSTSELSSGTPDPNPLKAVALAASFTAGASKTAALAATVDLDPGATPGRLVAAINWGDGSPATAAVLVPAGPGFVVTGTHTYAKPGAFTAVVFVVDTGLGVTALTVGAVSVAPAPITAAGRAFTFTGSSVQFSGVVATVIDAGPGLPLNAYVATIAWGDGTTTVGTLTGRGGSFSVQASRRFTRFAGTRTAIITVADAAGRRAVALDPYSFK